MGVGPEAARFLASLTAPTARGEASAGSRLSGRRFGRLCRCVEVLQAWGACPYVRPSGRVLDGLQLCSSLGGLYADERGEESSRLEADAECGRGHMSLHLVEAVVGLLWPWPHPAQCGSLSRAGCRSRMAVDRSSAIIMTMASEASHRSPSTLTPPTQQDDGSAVNGSLLPGRSSRPLTVLTAACYRLFGFTVNSLLDWLVETPRSSREASRSHACMVSSQSSASIELLTTTTPAA